jgi:hypothetical protein
MQNKLQLSGQIIKNGSYYILKTDDFDILIVCYSLQFLEKWLGDTVTITGRLRKVKAFHIYAEKIEYMLDPLKREQPKIPALPAKVAENTGEKPEMQPKIEEIDIQAGFFALVKKLKNLD